MRMTRQHGSRPTGPPRLLLVLGWLLVVVFSPAMSCPAVVPPPTLPLPVTADPPPADTIQVQVSAGAGTSDDLGSFHAGGALRGTYTPFRGFLFGFELGGGYHLDRSGDSLEDESDTVITGRLLVGYSLYVYPPFLSVAAETGLSPGLHNNFGGFFAPDFTLSVTAGGRRWWALTAGYRLAYSLPSREGTWEAALHHLVAVTLLVPRFGRYAGYVQIGANVGDTIPAEEQAKGFTVLAGFRFSYPGE